MKPLRTMRVLDLTDGNPYASSMFADYGAEVIKIERPGNGDSTRMKGISPGESEGPYYAYYGRNKKSVTVDWTRPEGQEIIKKLVSQADMLVINTAEEKMAAYGLSYPALREINPKIVYGVLTPFGEDGPWKEDPDYDLLVMARTGLLHSTGFQERPTKFGYPLSRYFSSWQLSAGMLAAYLKAQETGEGCKVSNSAWHAVFAIDDFFIQTIQGSNILMTRAGNGVSFGNQPTDAFQCKNGWFTISMNSDDQWIAFARAAGQTIWAEDPRYAHNPARSEENYFGDLDKQLREYFASITIEEAEQVLKEAMVPGGPCNTVKELVEDNKQVEAREMLLYVDDPIHGKTLQPGMPAKFLRDNESDNIVTPASCVGADTISVLTELKLSEAQIAVLKDSKVI